ncbi:ATPase assembly factor ATP10, partial [Vararia minispora EC-137]
PLPLLQRPLGVPEKPTAHVQTFDERSKELIFDDEKRMEQRRHLVKEASKGYYQDLHMVRFYGGKTWIAQKALIREDKALYFPNIAGSRLSDGQKVHTTDVCKGKVSVIAMLSTQISQHHAMSFTHQVNEKYRHHPGYQFVQVNLQENVLKSFLVSLFLSSLRNAVPEPLHPTYILSRQNMEYVREPLGMTNTRIGYVYLVDEDLRVRWAGCAEARPEEQEGLMLGTTVLLRRHEK